MANRSDFFTAKLPRGYKRMLAMEQVYGLIKDSHDRGSIKKLLISAHSNAVGFKLKRNSADVKESSDSE
jgi:hypothetical protein